MSSPSTSIDEDANADAVVVAAVVDFVFFVFDFFVLSSSVIREIAGLSSSCDWSAFCLCDLCAIVAVDV